MIEKVGNMWDQEGDAFVITTNGFVKVDGRAVMGRGCAKQACGLMPDIDLRLGNQLSQQGLEVAYISDYKIHHPVFSYPVKAVSEVCLLDKSNVVRHMRNKFNVGNIVPGWACVARVDLIYRSAHELLALVNTNDYKQVIMPRPGCGAGELNWYETVYPILSDILDNRFSVYTY